MNQCESASANTLKSLVNLHKRALKATQCAQNHNFNDLKLLFSVNVSVKERLNYNKGVLTHKGMSGNIPLKIVRQNVPKTNHDITRLKLYDKMFLKPITTFWKAQYTNL